MAALRPNPKFKGSTPFADPPTPEELAEEGMSSSRSSSSGRAPTEVLVKIPKTAEQIRKEENEAGLKILAKTVVGRGKRTRKRKHRKGGKTKKRK